MTTRPTADGPPRDRGLPNERTGLAWQRTLLTGLTSSLLVARLLASVSLTVALAVGLLALGCTAGLGVVALQRFRAHEAALSAGRPLSDGRPQGLLTGLVVLTAVGALLYAGLP